MNAHYLTELPDEDGSQACGWLYCVTCLYSLKRIEEISFTRTNGIGMSLIAKGNLAEDLMLQCYKTQRKRFDKLYPDFLHRSPNDGED